MSPRHWFVPAIVLAVVGCNRATDPPPAANNDGPRSSTVTTMQSPRAADPETPNEPAAPPATPAAPRLVQKTDADAHRLMHFERGPELTLHTDEITGAAFSPDGRRIATVGRDRKLKLSDAATHALLLDVTLTPPAKEITYYGLNPSVAFAPHGDLMAVAIGEAVRLFNATDGTLEANIAPERDVGQTLFQRVGYSPDGKWLVAHNVFENELFLWSAADRRLRHQWQRKKAFAFSPDGRTLITDGPEKSIELYDAESGMLQHRLAGAQLAEVRGLAVDPTGAVLAAVDDDGRLVIYDLATRAERFHVDDWGRPNVLLFTPDGLLLTEDGEFHLVGARGVDDVGECPVEWVEAITVSADGRQVMAVGDGDGHRADIFSIEWSLEERTPVAVDDYIGACALDRLGKQAILAEGDYDGETGKLSTTLAVYSLETGARRSTVVPGVAAYDPENLAVAPDGAQLFLGNLWLVQRVSLADLKPGPQWTSRESVEQVCYTPDGKQVLVVRDANDVWVLDAATGKPSGTVLTVGGDRVGFVPGDKPLLVACNDSTLRIFTWPDAKQLVEWNTGPRVTEFAASPDAKHVATTSRSSQITIWDATSGAAVVELDAWPDEVTALAFSADGKHLVAGMEKGSLAIWSTADWSLRAQCRAHNREVKSIHFTPDGPTFFTEGSLYRGWGVKQWDLAKLLERIPPPPSPTEQSKPPVTFGLRAHDFFEADGHYPAGFVAGGKALYGRDEQYINLFDAESRHRLQSLDIGRNWTAELSADGRVLAAVYEPDDEADRPDRRATIKLWDFPTEKLRHTLTIAAPAAPKISLSPDGATLAVAVDPSDSSKGPEISFWNTGDGTRQAVLELPRTNVMFLRYTTDGKLLVAAEYDIQGNHTLVARDAATREERFRRQVPKWPDDVAVSPDGKWLAVGGGDGEDGYLKILDAATGEVRPGYEEVRDSVDAVAFSPAGDLLIAAYENGDENEEGYRVWSFPEGKLLRRVIVDGWANGGRITFSPDGKWFASNTVDRLQLWNLADLLDEQLQRDLQAMSERRAYLDYAGDLPQVGHRDANDRELSLMPIFTRPFALSLEGAEAVTDAGLAHLAKQPNLAGLNLAGCYEVTPAGVRAAVQGKPLRTLNLVSTEIDSATTELIGTLTELEHLAITPPHDGKTADAAFLAKLVRLRELEFPGFPYPSEALVHLKGLVELRRLELGATVVDDDDDLQALSKLTNLRRLKIESFGDSFTGAGLAHLAGNVDLEVLEIGACRGINDDGVATIAAFKNLRELDLSRTAVTDRGMAAVAGMTKLEKLELPPKVGDAGLKHLAECTRIIGLRLRGADISDEGLMHLAKLDALDWIGVYENPRVVGHGFAAFDGAPEMTALHLNDLTGLTDDGLKGVAQVAQLEELWLPPQITDAGLAHLGPLKKLHDLHVEQAKLTSAGIDYLAALPELQRLDLSGTPLTDADLPHFEKLEKLSSLTLDETQVTADGVARLKKSFADRKRSLSVSHLLP